MDILFTEDDIKKQIQKIAKTINNDFKDQEVILLCILKGSIYITCELAKYLEMPINFEFMQVSSYKDDKSTGNVIIKKDLDISIENKNVIIVEDIVDSGITLSKLIPVLKSRDPKKLKVFTLINKPAKRKVEIDVDYNCFTIDEDYFLVGYGLDYNQKYRNLPYVGILK